MPEFAVVEMMENMRLMAGGGATLVARLCRWISLRTSRPLGGTLEKGTQPPRTCSRTGIGPCMKLEFLLDIL